MSLFDKNDRYTPEANNIESEICSAVEPIIRKYASRCLSIREIQYIAESAVMQVCLSELLSPEASKREVR